jgi:hypothetical protein
LLALIIKHAGNEGIEEENATDLYLQLMAQCGSVERAIQLFESGQVIMEKCP